MTLFWSDNVTPACNEVMNAIANANSGVASSYGNDDWSAELQRVISEIFERNVAVFPVVTGTASNALALSSLAPRYGKVFCHELAHINTDECAAPEFFTGGAKMIPLPGVEGKISTETLRAAIRGTGNVHLAQPAAFSLTQACETGHVYEVDEIASLAEIAHGHGLAVHMDGARFANALATLDVSPAQMTWQAGVDVLSLGGTKNGCVVAEVVVFFDPKKADDFAYLQKRAGQLLSKMRFISAQLVAYLSDDLWLRNARHANAQAKRLSDGLAAIPGVERPYPTRSNEVFVRLPDAVKSRIKEAGFEINDDELDGSATRFVTAWNTEAGDVDRLLAAANSAIARTS